MPSARTLPDTPDFRLTSMDYCRFAVVKHFLIRIYQSNIYKEEFQKMLSITNLGLPYLKKEILILILKNFP